MAESGITELILKKGEKKIFRSKQSCLKAKCELKDNWIHSLIHRYIEERGVLFLRLKKK